MNPPTKRDPLLARREGNAIPRLLLERENERDTEREREQIGESKLHRQPNLHHRHKPHTRTRETRESSCMHTRFKASERPQAIISGSHVSPRHTLCTVVRCRSCHPSHACPLPSIRKLRHHQRRRRRRRRRHRRRRCRRRRRRRRRENAAFEKESSHPVADQSSTNLRRPRVAGRIYLRALLSRGGHAPRTHPTRVITQIPRV